MKNGNIKYLLLFFIALLIVLVATSCVVTKKQKEKHCKACVLKESVKDSISVIIKDREVKVFIRDTIKVKTPNPCADLCDSLGHLKNFDRTIPGKPGTSTRLFTRNDSLLVEAMADSLKATATVKDTTTNHFREVTQQVPAKCEKRHLTDWDIIWIKAGRILSGLLALFILLKVAKIYLKASFPAVAKFLP